MCKYIDCKVWDEITYPFPNFNDEAVEIWEWISNFIPHYSTSLAPTPHPLPTKAYTVFVAIFGVFFQWEARVREIDNKGSFFFQI